MYVSISSAYFEVGCVHFFPERLAIYTHFGGALSSNAKESCRGRFPSAVLAVWVELKTPAAAAAAARR